MNCIRDSHYQFSWKDESDDEPVAPPVLDPLPDDPHLLLDSTMMVNGWPTFYRTKKPEIPNLEACIQKLERKNKNFEEHLKNIPTAGRLLAWRRNPELAAVRALLQTNEREEAKALRLASKPRPKIA